MRASLDTLRTGARYLSPALVSSPAPVVRARLYGHPHAYLAATLERLAARGLTPRLVVE